MIRVSVHAIERYIERVEPVSVDEAERRLSSPAILTAAAFGHCAVKLPGGHRVIVRDHTVITVTPPRFIKPARKARHEQA